MLKVSLAFNVLLERKTTQNRKISFVPIERKLEIAYIEFQNIDLHLRGTVGT